MFSDWKLKKLCSMSLWVEGHTNQTRQVQVLKTKNQWKSPKKKVLTQQLSKVGDMEMTQSRPRKIQKNLQNLRILPELGMFHFSLAKRIYFSLEWFQNWCLRLAPWLAEIFRAAIQAIDLRDLFSSEFNVLVKILVF